MFVPSLWFWSALAGAAVFLGLSAGLWHRLFKVRREARAHWEVTEAARIRAHEERNLAKLKLRAEQGRKVWRPGWVWMRTRVPLSQFSKQEVHGWVHDRGIVYPVHPGAWMVHRTEDKLGQRNTIVDSAWEGLCLIDGRGAESVPFVIGDED